MIVLENLILYILNNRSIIKFSSDDILLFSVSFNSDVAPVKKICEFTLPNNKHGMPTALIL